MRNGNDATIQVVQYADEHAHAFAHRGLRSGRATRTVVPAPGSLSMRRLPPWRVVQYSATASPRPVPAARVVKKGVVAWAKNPGLTEICHQRVVGFALACVVLALQRSRVADTD